MRINTRKLSAATLYAGLVFLLGAARVSAHTSAPIGDLDSLRQGFTHPIFGFDHLLAMIAVGVLSTKAGERGIVRVPGVFVLSLVIGAIIGLAGFTVVGLEYYVIVSVAILFASVFVPGDLPLVPVLVFAGIAGLFHGNAHGLEAPEQGSAFYFVVGFSIASILMHVTGIGIGLGVQRYHNRNSQTLKIARPIQAEANRASLSGEVNNHNYQKEIR